MRRKKAGADRIRNWCRVRPRRYYFLLFGFIKTVKEPNDIPIHVAWFGQEVVDFTYDPSRNLKGMLHDIRVCIDLGLWLVLLLEFLKQKTLTLISSEQYFWKKASKTFKKIYFSQRPLDWIYRSFEALSQLEGTLRLDCIFNFSGQSKKLIDGFNFVAIAAKATNCTI